MYLQFETHDRDGRSRASAVSNRCRAVDYSGTSALIQVNNLYVLVIIRYQHDTVMQSMTLISQFRLCLSVCNALVLLE